MKTLSLVFALAIVVASEVIACSCDPHDLPQDVSRTATIYFARLTAAREIEPKGEDMLGYYEVEFKITEPLRGQSHIGERRGLVFLRCAVPLVIGDEYAVFEREVGKTTRCWGTDHFDGSDWKRDERRKAQIRKQVKTAVFRPRERPTAARPFGSLR